MKQYQGKSVSPGLVLGQVSLLKRETYLFNRSQHSPEKELLVLEEAVRIAQNELDSMAGQSAASEQAIFTFQSMLLEDDTFMGEVRSYIQAGTGAAEAMNRVGQRYADKMLAMTDNAYLQLRNVDILDATQRVVNILAGRPRVLLTLDHPVILAADKLMPSDLFSIPSGMILGIITSEGSTLSHAAIIARARGIPSIIQVGRDFLDDCDGRIVVLDADKGTCILDPDADTRQLAVGRICARQQAEEDTLEAPVRTMPCRTRDGAPFELLANCFGPEDIGSALQSGAAGVGLLRSDYQILAGNTFDEQEQLPSTSRSSSTTTWPASRRRGASPSPSAPLISGPTAPSPTSTGGTSRPTSGCGASGPACGSPAGLKTRSAPCCVRGPSVRCGSCSPW